MNEKRFLTFILLISLVLASGPRVAQGSGAPSPDPALSPSSLALASSPSTGFAPASRAQQRAGRWREVEPLGANSVEESGLFVPLDPSIVEGSAFEGASTPGEHSGDATTLSASSGQALPTGVSADWWSAVQEDIRQSEYRVTWQDQTYLSDLPAAYQAPNRAHNLRTYFTPAGIRVIPRTETCAGEACLVPAWEWGLTLTGYGYGDNLQPVAPAELVATGNRIEYRRGNLTEWYVNDECGLEQGFTLVAPPKSQTQNPAKDTQAKSQIALKLALTDDLSPHLADDSQTIEFTTSDGVIVLSYSDLYATDATGRTLPAQLETRNSKLAILVDTTAAVYPITIDPTIFRNWLLYGDQRDAWFGWSVGTAGDVNNDGYDDVIIGAPEYDSGQEDEGRAYVYYGSAAGLSTDAYWTAEGDQEFSDFGVSVGTAGDVNGDGYADVIVGMPFLSTTRVVEPRVYVYYGSTAGLPDADSDGVAHPSDANWAAEGDQVHSQFGLSVGTAGDVNNDGYDDVIVGANHYSNDQESEGRVFVYHGLASGLPDADSDGVAHLNDANWMAESDQANVHFRISVGTAGDVNGDGYADVIIGAAQYDNDQQDEGRVFVYHGSASGLPDANSDGLAHPSDANWMAESDQVNAEFGYSVGTAGDVNNDDYDDVIVGARLYSNPEQHEGRVFVYQGSASGLPDADSDGLAHPSDANWMAESDQVGAWLGYNSAVGTAGDINGDGYADIIIGAPYYSNGQVAEGRIFVYHGSASGLPDADSDGVARPSDANLMAERNLSNILFGFSAGAAGDVNGDGYADLIAGAPEYANDRGLINLYPGGASSISGRVTDLLNGSPISGVTIGVPGTFPPGLTAVTDSYGNYTLSGLPLLDHFQLEPSKVGYEFLPASRSGGLSASQPDATGQDFKGLATTLSISGRVTDFNGNPVPGVTIDTGIGRVAITDNDGNYTLRRMPPGPYILIPSKGGYAFAPASRAVNLPPDATGQDFTGYVQPPPPIPNLTVSGIEVSQAIQTTDNSVPLVAGRPTIARVQIGVQNVEPIAGVTTLLHAARNNTELPNSPIEPFNPGGSIVAPLMPDREQFDHTLNFLLPEDWIEQGELTLWAEVNPSRTVDEEDYGDNRSAIYSLYFLTVPPLEVQLIPIAYQPNGQGPVLLPRMDNSNYFGLGRLLPCIYPIPNTVLTFHPKYSYKGDLNTEEGWSDLLYEINQLRQFERPGGSGLLLFAMPKYYGVVPAGTPLAYGGLGYFGGASAIGLDVAGAHEIGHNLGLQHVDCGNPDNPDPNYPPEYVEGIIGNVGVNVYTRFHFIPSVYKDVMSYCTPQWISDYHFLKLLTALLRAQVGQSSQRATLQASQTGWLISGQIGADGTSGSLDYARPISTTNIVVEPGLGDYRIELRDTSGVIQFSYAFTPTQIVAQDGTLLPSHFGFIVPRIPDLGSIQLWKETTQLTTLTAASAYPTLMASHTYSGTQVNVSWQASSPDGSATFVTLRYSPDDGQIWQVLALDLTTTSLDLSTTQLPASTNGILEVIANNTTEAQTARLELGPIANKPPRVGIFGDQHIQLYSGEPLILIGAAVDLEDGSIPDTDLHWSHPQLGALDTGQTLILPQGLAEGEHTITLTATDSAGAQDQTTVTVTVTPSHPVVWSDVCVAQRMEITGIGMGDRHHTINPQTLSLSDPARVNWLLAQMAGRSATVPDSVAFTTDAPQSLTMIEPSNDTLHGYTFEASLQPTGQVTTSVSNPGDSYKTPRGLILYSKRATAGEWWTSVGKTTNNFVWRGSEDGTHTEVLTFPPLAEATDLLITAIVIDNDDDSRPMVLEATAGAVTDSVTEFGPTDGDGLNIVNLTLQQVPAGTDQVSVTLRSPSEDGDSLVLVGLNVSYPCLAPTGAILHVVPSPATIPLGATDVLTVSVTPGPAEVNGVQVHGRLDPTYLHLIDVRPTGVLPAELDPVAFDPATGEFRYGAGLLSGVITEPFGVLVLEVQAVATITGTLVEFLGDFPPTDISGPEGSVLSQAQDGLVIVAPPPTLRGSVDMQGRPPKPAPQWAIPLTVWLTPFGSGAPTHTFTTITDQNGTFGLYLDGVVPGLYDVRVKGNHTLRNLVPDVNLVSGDNAYFLGRLLEGDVETVATFNQVRQEDADMLIGSFNRCDGDLGFVPNADLDESGCVLLPDFGLLSGNFGKEGDIVITPTASLRSRLLQASGAGALMAFNAGEMVVAVDEVLTLTLDIDPRGQLVNGGMVHLGFDPALVEILDVTLTDRLPLMLAEPSVDNQQGVVRFATGILGQTITERFSIATLLLRVKGATAGTTITPVDLFPGTNVSGPRGSVLAEARGIMLRTEAQGQAEYTIYLPIIMK